MCLHDFDQDETQPPPSRSAAHAAPRFSDYRTAYSVHLKMPMGDSETIGVDIRPSVYTPWDLSVEDMVLIVSLKNLDAKYVDTATFQFQLPAGTGLDAARRFVDAFLDGYAAPTTIEDSLAKLLGENPPWLTRVLVDANVVFLDAGDGSGEHDAWAGVASAAAN